MDKKWVLLIITLLVATSLWGGSEDVTAPYLQYINELALDNFDSPPSAEVFLERQALNELIIADIYAYRSLRKTLKENPDASIRTSIAYILGEISNPHSDRCLSNILSAENENVLTRISALAALEKISGESLQDSWKHLFKDKSHEHFYQIVSSPPRLSADEVEKRLKNVIHYLTRDDLIIMSIDFYEFVRTRAIRILSSIGKPAIPELLARWQPGLFHDSLTKERARLNILAALCHMDKHLLSENQEVEVIFTQGLYGPSRGIPILAITGLNKIGSESAKTHLKWVSLYSQNPWAREHAQKALTMEYEALWDETTKIINGPLNWDAITDYVRTRGIEILDSSESEEKSIATDISPYILVLILIILILILLSNITILVLIFRSIRGKRTWGNSGDTIHNRQK